MFDFRRITLLCLGYRLSSNKFSKNLVALSSRSPRPGYAYVSDTIVPLAIPVLVAASRRLSCTVSSGIQLLFLL